MLQLGKRLYFNYNVSKGKLCVGKVIGAQIFKAPSHTMYGKKVFDIGWSQIVLRAVRLPVLLSRLGLERDLRSVRARSVLRSWIQEVLRMLQGLLDLFWTFKHGLQIVPKSIPGNFFKKIWANPGLFFAYFRPFLITISIIQIEKV